MTAFTRLALALVLALGLGAGQALAFGQDDDSSSSSKPKNSDYSQAVKWIKAGDYARAIPLLDKTVSADPTNADAYNYLGYSHRKLGDKETAFANYAKALKLQPKHRGANEYLGELYLEMGQLDKAKERLDVLDNACFFGCEEYRELKQKIQAYQAKTGS